MTEKKVGLPIEILTVEDNLGYVRLTQEALKDAHLQVTLSVVKDGVEALDFLRREGGYADAPRPDLILLDLNLPRKSGHEVLAEIKTDPDLKNIPVVVLTNSLAETDIRKANRLHADYYCAKPDDLEQFSNVMRSIKLALSEKEGK